MAATDLTVAVDKRGRTTPLGDFVFGLLEAKGMSVSEFARRSQLSRSFLYLLRDDKQVPSLDTLVTLFRALEVDDVRVADVGEPGDLALAVDGKPWWIRLPSTNRRSARSVEAFQLLSAPPLAMAADAGPEVAGAVAVSSSPTKGAAYSREHGWTRSTKVDPRQRLLGELLAAAGDLDRERLELLVEHARLLGRG